MTTTNRRPQVCILDSADPAPVAYELAGQAGAMLAQLSITVVSGCGSAATSAEWAIHAICNIRCRTDGGLAFGAIFEWVSDG